MGAMEDPPVVSTVMVTCARAALLAALLLAVGSPPAAALEIDCDAPDAPVPCAFDLERDGVLVQKAPAMFKFQARVAQRKMPSGDGTFSKLIVRLRDGAAGAGPVLCEETFEKVRVRDSVLNLDIGRKVDCELDEVLAERESLHVELCIKSTTTCLPPVRLPAVPYAVRATFANRAETAQHANIAAQAGYAHRLTADRELFLRKVSATDGLGLGYLDFHGPTEAPTQAAPGAPGLVPAALYDEIQTPGWVQWTPLRWALVSDPRAWTLHLAGRIAASGALQKLSQLVVLAGETHVLGHLVMKGPGNLTVEAGGADINGYLIGNKKAHVTKNVHVGDYLYGDGGAVFLKPVSVGDDLTVSYGTASLERLTVTSGGLDVTGASDLGSVIVNVDKSATPADDDLVVKGTFTATGTVTSNLGVQAAGPGKTSMVRADGGAVALGQVGGGDFSRIVVKGPVHVTGDAVVEAPTTVSTLVSTTVCPAGFVATINGTCADLDECAHDLDNCAANAICTNAVAAEGRFKCACPAGLRGDPTKVCGKGVFATQKEVQGRIEHGGKVGWAAAHQLCQDEANAAGVGGHWIPFLGMTLPDSPWSPADQLGEAVYLRMGDFLVLANSKAQLLDGSLDHPLDKSAGGVSVFGQTWAGATTAGVAKAQNCSGWTSTSGTADQFRMIFSPFMSVQGNQACGGKSRVLCVEL